jgi:hypothetical protein
MIVADVIANQSAQVVFIQDDHMVQQFSSAAFDPTLRHTVLPGTNCWRKTASSSPNSCRERKEAGEPTKEAQEKPKHPVYHYW